MAENKYIDELTEIAESAVDVDADWLVIEDVSAVETKKIKYNAVKPSHTYVVNSSATDHGASSTGSLYAVLTALGTSTKATVYLPHDPTAGSTTTYTVSTIYDASSYDNITFVLENGSLLSVDSGITLTLPSPAHIQAQPAQQIFSGSGTIAFSKGGVVYPQWWGATGDGSTDDTTELQACITAAEGSTVDLGDNELTYVVTTSLTVPSNIRITANGATIDASGLISGTVSVLTAAGTAGTGTAISSGSSIRSYEIVVASASGFSEDDFVLVSSNDEMPYTDATYDYYNGEILQIRTISGTTITFTTPLNSTYEVASTPLMTPITWKEDIHIHGIRILGANTPDTGQIGITLRYCKRFSVTNCVFDKLDTYCVEVNSSILGEVSGNTIWGVHYPGLTGTGSFYGVILLNCAEWVNVTNNIGNRVRHLVVTTANSQGVGYRGQPMFCNIIGNILNNAMSGGTGRSYAFENHGFGVHLLWANNVANGCYSGFNIENGTGNTIIGNIIRNYASSGIIIGGSGQGATNLLIANNNISSMTNEISGAAAILVEDCTGSFNNLVISGNVIRDPYNTTDNESGIDINANTHYYNCVIENNKIYSTTENDHYAIRLEADSGSKTTDGWVVAGNEIYGYTNGIVAYGDRAVIKNNIIRNSAAAVSGYGLYVNGTKCVVQGNTVIYIYTIGRLYTSSDSCVFVNNTAIDCTAGDVVDNGTGNTVSDNYKE